MGSIKDMLGDTLFSERYPENVPPEVCQLFEKLALQVRAAGFTRYSADAILHRLRWEAQIERGNREFTVNNDWAAPLARWTMNRHIDLATIKFFETRKSPTTEK